MNLKSLNHYMWLVPIALIAILVVSRWQDLQITLANNILQIKVTNLSVQRNSGSTCYLAKGRPVISSDAVMQDLNYPPLNSSLSKEYITSLARARLLMGQQVEDTSLLIHERAAHPDDPLLALVTLDVLQLQNELSSSALPSWWIWKGYPFLARADCWLTSEDPEQASKSFTLFLQAMSGQWSPDSLRRGAQFFIKLRNYCNHLPTCFPGSSDILPRLMEAFKDASQSPDNATGSAALFYIGQIHASEGLLNNAILSYQQSIAVDPANLAYRVHLGAALSAVHQDSEGKAQLLQALQIASTDDERSWIFGELGYAALLSGQVEEAIGRFQDSIRLGTKDDSYRIGLGRAYWKAGRPADARQVLTEVVRKAPDRSDAWLYLGLFLSEQGDLSQAISAFKEAVSLAPRNIDYRLILADALVRHGLESEATSEYKTVLGLDPGNVPAQRYLNRFSDPANN